MWVKEKACVSPEELTDWAEDWQRRRQLNTADPEDVTRAMQWVNPAIIPRNHLVQRGIDLAEKGELGWVERLVQRGRKPFEWQADDLEWARPPHEDERVTRTFCGT